METFIHFIYDTCLGFLAKVVGCVMVLSVVVQIACRYLPMTPFGWTEELARLTFIWFCFIGAAMTLSRMKHLTIDYFYLKMNEQSKFALNVLTWVVVTVFSSIAAYYGATLVTIVAMQKSPMLQLPMSYFYASVPFGCGLFAFYGFVSLVWCIMGKHATVVISDEVN